VKSRLVLPFWYRPTRVVLAKGPLNGCVCVCVSWQRIVFAVAETDHHRCQCCWTHSACVSMCTGVELSVCEAWSRGSRRRSRERHHGDAPLSCCTRQMEARLSTHARHELSRLLTEQLDDVRHDFSNADAQFQSRPQHQNKHATGSHFVTQ